MSQVDKKAQAHIAKFYIRKIYKDWSINKRDYRIHRLKETARQIQEREAGWNWARYAFITAVFDATKREIPRPVISRILTKYFLTIHDKS